MINPKIGIVLTILANNKNSHAFGIWACLWCLVYGVMILLSIRRMTIRRRLEFFKANTFVVEFSLSSRAHSNVANFLSVSAISATLFRFNLSCQRGVAPEAFSVRVLNFVILPAHVEVGYVMLALVVNTTAS